MFKYKSANSDITQPAAIRCKYAGTHGKFHLHRRRGNIFQEPQNQLLILAIHEPAVRAPLALLNTQDLPVLLSVYKDLTE